MSLQTVHKALEECADDLKGEIDARYGDQSDIHPAMKTRYDRDMVTVHEAKAALKDLKEYTERLESKCSSCGCAEQYDIDELIEEHDLLCSSCTIRIYA